MVMVMRNVSTRPQAHTTMRNRRVESSHALLYAMSKQQIKYLVSQCEIKKFTKQWLMKKCITLQIIKFYPGNGTAPRVNCTTLVSLYSSFSCIKVISVSVRYVVLLTNIPN